MNISPGFDSYLNPFQKNKQGGNSPKIVPMIVK